MPVRKPIQLRSSSSDLLSVRRIDTNIWANFRSCTTLWKMIPFSVRSVETQLRGVSVQLLTTGIFINCEIDQPYFLHAPLSWVSKDLGSCYCYMWLTS